MLSQRNKIIASGLVGLSCLWATACSAQEVSQTQKLCGEHALTTFITLPEGLLEDAPASECMSYEIATKKLSAWLTTRNVSVRDFDKARYKTHRLDDRGKPSFKDLQYLSLNAFLKGQLAFTDEDDQAWQNIRDLYWLMPRGYSQYNFSFDTSRYSSEDYKTESRNNAIYTLILLDRAWQNETTFEKAANTSIISKIYRQIVQDQVYIMDIKGEALPDDFKISSHGLIPYDVGANLTSIAVRAIYMTYTPTDDQSLFIKTEAAHIDAMKRYKTLTAPSKYSKAYICWDTTITSSEELAEFCTP